MKKLSVFIPFIFVFISACSQGSDESTEVLEPSPKIMIEGGSGSLKIDSKNNVEIDLDLTMEDPDKNKNIIRNFNDYNEINQSIRLAKVDTSEVFEHPWGMAFINDLHLVITEKNGTLSHINLESSLVKKIDHNIPSVQYGQGGLLDVIYHKNFLYLSFTIEDLNGKTTTAIGRGKILDPYNKLEDFEILFTALPFLKDGKHYGSRLSIKNNMLFISIGERGQGSIAQDALTHPGSIIRLNLDGTPPKDNPHFLDKKDWQPEIFQIGVRNPQGMTLSPDNEIFISSHGAKGGDFIAKLTRGGNFGWNKIGWGGTNYSGSKIGDGEPFKKEFDLPLLSWVPSIAPSDLIFYSGSEFLNWNGSLLVTSLKFEMLLKIDIDDENNILKEEIVLKEKIGRIRDVDVNSQGEVFLISDEPKSYLWKLTKN